ncbi:hypothetical protein DAPPUDRAFT_263175 [Daphnia pulex]|uniref:Uncharacterized protein n=1 Tax=Daphnia pulex TaxID=6669 RepID=E9HP94_DAPPU|nr:hypothetical protein DAPPUDRAFT_263175 [Daphnia pulex]|eukprot:EFX66399.1 hypothetical protein DAPPUDRAFT_263175 [Daphnia pulex]
MECPELDTRGNIFANGYLLSELGINNDLDVSFAYRNSYCLAMTLPPRDNPKGLADEPVDGVGSLSLPEKDAFHMQHKIKEK